MPGSSPRYWLVAAGALVAVWLALVLRFWFLCDDAFISFRYARNLAEGLGLTYHALDEPPVEGYSHLLWVLWLGLGDRLGLPPEHVAPWTSAAVGLLLLLGVARCLLRLGVRHAGVCAALAFLACMPPLALWSTGGLETMPAAWCGWVLWNALFGPGPRRVAHAVLAAAALCLLRPEGPAIVAAMAGLQWLLGWRTQLRTLDRRMAYIVAAAAAVTVAAHVAFRLATYGDWLPNTVRAKGDFTWFRAERGFHYLASCLLTFPGAVVALAMGLLAWRSGTQRRTLVAAFAVVALHAAFAIRVGGDFMPMARFLVPALPMIAVGFGVAVDRLVQRGRATGAACLVVAVCTVDLMPAFDLGVVPAAVRNHWDFRWGLPVPATEFATWRALRDGARNDEVLARALNRHTRPGERLIREAIGVVGYRSHLRMLDTFGLVTARPEDDYSWLPRGTPGHDRYLAWSVLLDQRPEYHFAHLATHDEPVNCSMLATPFAMSPLAQRVRVLRFPVDEPDASGRTVELRLLRFVAFDDPTAPIAPLLAAVKGTDPADPSASKVLERNAGSAAARWNETLRDPAVIDRLVPHGAAPLRFGHVADPTRRTSGYWIDAALQSGPGLRMDFPRGKIVYAVAVDGEPRVNGREPGWIVVPPAAGYQDVVTGGSALLVQFVPENAHSVPSPGPK